jgi:hypothetical protein
MIGVMNRKAESRNASIRRKIENPEPPAEGEEISHDYKWGPLTYANPLGLECNRSSHRTYCEERKEQL